MSLSYTIQLNMGISLVFFVSPTYYSLNEQHQLFLKNSSIRIRAIFLHFLNFTQCIAYFISRGRIISHYTVCNKYQNIFPSTVNISTEKSLVMKLKIPHSIHYIKHVLHQTLFILFLSIIFYRYLHRSYCSQDSDKFTFIV